MVVPVLVKAAVDDLAALMVPWPCESAAPVPVVVADVTAPVISVIVGVEIEPLTGVLVSWGLAGDGGRRGRSQLNAAVTALPPLPLMSWPVEGALGGKLSRIREPGPVPVEDGPVVDEPVVVAPVVDTPVAEPPVAEAPVVAAPVVAAPVVAPPVVEAPVADAPAVAAPVVAAPVVEAPVVEAPVVAAPVVAAPVVAAPVVAAPVVEAPAANDPAVAAAGTGVAG
jgi:hypothetical protein